MSGTIIAIVKGGLGNQLFIYAAARALALRTGRHLFLDTKRGFLRDDYGRCYRLDRFPISAEAMPEAWRIAPTLRHPRHKIIRAWNKVLPRNWRGYFAERWNRPPSQLTTLQPRRERIVLLGYWQDEAYFADRAAELRGELSTPEPGDARNRALGRRLREVESVSVHIRRRQFAHTLHADYYREAVARARTTCRSPTFVLFGDEVDWALREIDFAGAAVEVVAHNEADEIADLWLMTCCRHSIVANSSFSWWGAWLAGGRGIERKVWAPATPGWPIVMSDSWEILENRLEAGNSM
jgi:hypothetical protein